jgi:hypothetical protein
MPTTHTRTANPFNADTPVGLLAAWAELQADLCASLPTT